MPRGGWQPRREARRQSGDASLGVSLTSMMPGLPGYGWRHRRNGWDARQDVSSPGRVRRDPPRMAADRDASRGWCRQWLVVDDPPSGTRHVAGLR